MKLRRFLSLIAALLIVALPSFAFAQNNGAQNAGQGLEISPPLVDIEANPGEQKIVEIFVRNITQYSLVVKAEVTDFTAAGEDGQPKLLLDTNEQSPYSIKPWIADLPSTTIKSGERIPFKISMNIPADAGPGGHYGVVRFTGTPPELEGTGVSLSASVGTLMLVRVSGNVTEQANIEEIVTSQNNKKKSVFEYGPVDFDIRVKNTGNVHIQPSGTVKVVNMWGKAEATYKFNENGGNILPQSIRKFSYSLKKKLLFGRYKIQADVVYGTENKIISSTKTFWVIPYKLIAIVIGTIVGLVFFIRQYNRYILKRANKKKQPDEKASRGKQDKE